MMQAGSSSWAVSCPVMGARAGVLFYFYIFQFRFLQKYIFVFEIYKYIPRPPSCRAGGTWSPAAGRQGVSTIFYDENLRAGPWRIGCPAAGRPVPQAARQRGGGPSRPPRRAPGSSKQLRAAQGQQRRSSFSQQHMQVINLLLHLFHATSNYL